MGKWIWVGVLSMIWSVGGEAKKDSVVVQSKGNGENTNKEKKENSIFDVFPIFNLLPKPHKFVFLECSVCKGIYPRGEEGPWGIGELPLPGLKYNVRHFGCRVLNLDFKFEKMNLELALVGVNFGLPLPIKLGIFPLQFSLSFPLDIFFKIKGDIFSLAMLEDPFDPVVGILFYYFGDAAVPDGFGPEGIFIPRLFLVETGVGKRWDWYLNDKIFIKFYPELELIFGYIIESSYIENEPLFSISIGGEIGLGRRVK
jgi:hypothetical protein